jgi:cell division protein FtsB
MTTRTTTEDFNLCYLQELQNSEVFEKQVEYINQYFIPLIDGTHAFKLKNKWVVYQNEVVKNVFFNRLNKDLNNYYFKKYNRILIPIYDKTKPQFFDDYINFDYQNEDLVIKPYKYLVDVYIQNNKGLNIKPSLLFKEYKEYSNESTIKKDEFLKILENVGINVKKSGTNVIKIDFQYLYNIAISNNWIIKDKLEIENDNLKKEVLDLKLQIADLKDEKVKEKNAIKRIKKKIEVEEEVVEVVAEEIVVDEVENEDSEENDEIEEPDEDDELTLKGVDLL